MSRDRYKDKSQAWEQSTDEKPKGKTKQVLHAQARAMLKKELEEEIKDINKDEQAEIDFMQHKEADEAIYCYRFGPCDRCLAKQQEEKTDE